MRAILARGLSTANRPALAAFALGLAAVAMLGVAPAAAQAQAQGSPAARNADDLVREGEALLKAAAEKAAQACLALDQRELVLPSVESKLALAACREQSGQLATALRLYTAVVAETRGDRDPRSVALHLRADERIAELGARLSLLTLVVDTDRLVGLEVYRNGEPVPAEQWNQPWPLDGGVYQLTAQAPGYVPWSGVISLQNEGDRQSLTLSPSVKPAIAASIDLSDPPLTAPSTGDIPSQRLPNLGRRPKAQGGSGKAKRERRGEFSSSMAEAAPSSDARVPLALGAAALTFGGVAWALEASARQITSSARSELERSISAPPLTGGLSADLERRYRRASEDTASGRRRHQLAQGVAVVAVGTAAVATYLWIRHLRSESASRRAGKQWAPTFATGDAGRGSVAGVQLSGEW